MKVFENGIYREMTAEEIAKMQESFMAAESTIEPLTDAKKAGTVACIHPRSTAANGRT